jgi:hypothetical protein
MEDLSSKNRRKGQESPQSTGRTDKAQELGNKALSASKVLTGSQIEQARLSASNRSHEGDAGMLPSAENTRQYSGEPRQPRYERQLTPGAADQCLGDNAGRFSRKRGSSAGEGTALAVSMAIDDLDDQHEPREDIAAVGLPDLNPEQALNLTDEDLSKLRKLLVEHVSAFSNRRFTA